MENQSQQLAPPLLFLRYANNRPVITKQKSEFADLELAARQFFSVPSIVQLKFFTKFAGDELVQIDPEAWPHIYETVTSIWVEAVRTPASVQSLQVTQPVRSSTSSVTALDNVRVRKPVIYLYPPTPISINVCLSLVKSWEFTAIYPLAPVKRSESHSAPPVSGETISWDVFAEPDGKLRLSDGLEVSYLYWEAEARACRDIVTPPVSRSRTPEPGLPVEEFDPSNPVLAPHNSVLLRVPVDLTKYIDKALVALGLHTEARTSFITFWLPLFVKHEYVALRFLEQSSYESAARLNITPKPDVVTRVFMLFRGIATPDLTTWAEAGLRAETMDIEAWRSIVGVDAGGMQREGLFRVLEWGGMEVR